MYYNSIGKMYKIVNIHYSITSIYVLLETIYVREFIIDNIIILRLIER